MKWQRKELANKISIQRRVKQMADLEYGVCGVCGKQNVRVHRKYYNYPDIKCECHSPHHFDLVLHCDDCEPKQPTYTRIQVRTDILRTE